MQESFVILKRLSQVNAADYNTKFNLCFYKLKDDSLSMQMLSVLN